MLFGQMNTQLLVFPAGSMVNELANTEASGLILGGGKIPWRRKWQATPIFLPRTFHGQRRLMVKLKCQYFGHLIQRPDSLEKTLSLEKIESRRRSG